MENLQVNDYDVVGAAIRQIKESENDYKPTIVWVSFRTKKGLETFKKQMEGKK